MLFRFLVTFGVVATLSGCGFLFHRERRVFIEYPVVKGDTVAALAKRFGSSIDEILTLNSIDDPRQLGVGTRLKIPLPPGVSPKEGVVKPSPRRQVRASDQRKVTLGKAARYVGELEVPVPGGRFESKFGSRWGSFHEGIDLSAPEGTPILAAHDGVVVYAGEGLRGYGLIVAIEGEGLTTVYAHNRRNLVRRGDKVRRGSRIALVGTTGKVTGPHLHFETRVRASDGSWVAIDPKIFFNR